MALDERIKEVFSEQNLKLYSSKQDSPLREISSKEKLVAYLDSENLPLSEEVIVETHLGNGGRQNTYRISIGNKLYAASIRKEKISDGETKHAFTLDDINAIPSIIPTYGLIRTRCQGEEYYFGTICRLIKNGMDLEWFIERNGYSPERGPINKDYLASVLSYLNQMLRSIKRLREKKLVHRDFKNSNILIEGKNAFLTDFDLMQHKNAITGSRIVGTAIFMSTEVLRAEPLDFRADLYSWAVCLAEGVGYLNPMRYSDSRLSLSKVMDDICDKDYLPKEEDKRLKHLPEELIRPITYILKSGLNPNREKRDIDMILSIFKEPGISDYLVRAQTENMDAKYDEPLLPVRKKSFWNFFKFGKRS